jgi:RecJ-like exonuclease
MIPTLTSINCEFMAHRRVCAQCGSDGPRVCETGVDLLLQYHQVIQDQIRKAARRNRPLNQRKIVNPVPPCSQCHGDGFVMVPDRSNVFQACVCRQPKSQPADATQDFKSAAAGDRA